MTRLILLYLFLLIGRSCGVSPGQDIVNNDLRHTAFVAEVDRIIDGDTMVVLYQGRLVRIRLTHIDAPENRRSNPISKMSTQALTTLCADSKVTVQSQGYDRYERLLAEVINHKGVVVNKEMVRLGMAVHYKRYSDNSTYAELEEQARKQKIGLWMENDSITTGDREKVIKK
ncbi:MULTISPECIES: thermonuclease family protein [Sphingobacterium]|uniref:thermonuclease family protein n=1 Tax=Sphingobacterium TaxID=28453 RepID=UPI0013DBC0F4|nr:MULTISPECIES: thermonuclease family protein [unclassified Sphingobacterium]